MACDEIEARNHAYAGRDDLKECDFESAYDHFEKAYGVLKNYEEVAIGTAFSLLLKTLHTEEMAQLQLHLGLTQTIQQFCLQQVEKNKAEEENQTQEDTKESDCAASPYPDISGSTVSWPHPCAGLDDCKFAEYIDTALQWQDVIQTIIHNRDALLDSSNILARAAEHMDEAYTMDDIFGLDHIALHPADIYLIAGMLKMLVAAADIASLYDTSFSVRDALNTSDCQKQTDLLNAHLGVAQNATTVSATPDLFNTAMIHFADAFRTGQELRSDVDNNEPEDDECIEIVSLFRWLDIPYGVSDNIIAITSAFSQLQAIPADVLLPDVTFDLSALFSDLPTRTPDNIVFSCDASQANYKIYIDAINRITTPYLLKPDEPRFHLNPDIGYRMSSGWRRWSFTDLL